MLNLANALAEVKFIEDFMRRRYLYNHPVFAHITRAVELLEREVAAIVPPPPPQEVITEPEIEEVAETEPEVITKAPRYSRR